MKIVIASHAFLPNIGGVSTSISILAKGFADAGHDVTVATLTPGPSDGFAYEVMRRPRAARLTRLYTKADILILSNLALKLIYPLLFVRRSFALQHHSESAFGLSSSPLSFDVLRRAVLHRARHFMTSAYVGQRSGFESYEITRPFANSEYITPEVRRPIAERRGLLFVGRLEEEKGVRYLLEQWPHMREILRVEELRIVGDGSLCSEIQTRIAAGELSGVTLVGRLLQDATASEMGRAAFVIVPSLWAEPFGAVALEALAAGALVILTDRGGLPETTGQCGYFFDPDKKGSLDKALLAVSEAFARQLADPAERARYEARVHAHVGDFTPSSVVQKIIQVMCHD